MSEAISKMIDEDDDSEYYGISERNNVSDNKQKGLMSRLRMIGLGRGDPLQKSSDN